ncbi:MAG: DoxX family protein [Pyrinomonadaceae bacterium]
MSKGAKITYWIATLWLSLGMFSTGLVQLLRMDEEVAKMNGLGYPSYLMLILGAWKMAGVAAVLAPGLGLLKEWAYAGFFFAMSGAAVSHIFVGDPITEILPSILLLVLTVVSWYLRPESRKTGIREKFEEAI